MHYQKQELVDFLAGNPPWVDTTSAWWRDQTFARRMAEDLVSLHNKVAEHSGKSKFGLGVVVGMSAGFVISEFILNKQKARWWRGFEEGRAAKVSE